MKNKEKYDLRKLNYIRGCDYSYILYNGEHIVKFKGVDHLEHFNTVVEWLEQEYQEPIKLTEDEKTILRNLDKRYKWITRSFGTLQIFENKPYKRDCGESWSIRKGWGDTLRPFNHLFAFIKATDEEPYSIEDLLTRGNEND